MVELYSSQSQTNFSSQTSRKRPYHSLITVRHFYFCCQILCNFRSNTIKKYDVIVEIVSSRTEKRSQFTDGTFYKLFFAVKRETNEFRLLFRLFFWFSCACVSFQSVECVIKSNPIIGTALVSPSRKITNHTSS